MRLASLSLLTLVAASALPLASRAAFEGDFYIVDGTTPAGVYNQDSGVASLGAWSASFFPSDNGDSFINTTAAPASVLLGASTAPAEGFEESTTALFIEMPEAGHVSFTVEVCNFVEGESSARFEIYLSGVDFYEYSLTETGGTTYNLGFDVFTGDTLEFRSVAVSGDLASFAANNTKVSEFTFTPASAIPEPATFASLLGLGVLGFAGRRRRRSAA